MPDRGVLPAAFVNRPSDDGLLPREQPRLWWITERLNNRHTGRHQRTDQSPVTTNPDGHRKLFLAQHIHGTILAL